MVVDVKVNIKIHCNDMSASIVLGPPENMPSPEEEAIKKLVWPYNYSEDGALLPGFTSNRDLMSITT